jgi:hypothetical protein
MARKRGVGSNQYKTRMVVAPDLGAGPDLMAQLAMEQAQGGTHVVGNPPHPTRGTTTFIPG